ncbi:MAG: hypothetical protein AAF678_00995 [Pseudomonadota bacterium]
MALVCLTSVAHANQSQASPMPYLCLRNALRDSQHLSMGPFHRAAIFLKYLFLDLPPVSWGRLIMPAGFIGSWSILRGFAIDAPVAFVWAAVFAQALQLWAVLPVTVKRTRWSSGDARQTLSWTLLIVLLLFALQIWWMDPVVSQRLVSLYCASYVAVMCWGVAGEATVRDRYVPVSGDSQVPEIFRTHLLKLYALMAFVLLVINEALIAAQAPLHVRVITLSLSPIALHYLFEILFRLTCPLEGKDST